MNETPEAPQAESPDVDARLDRLFGGGEPAETQEAEPESAESAEIPQVEEGEPETEEPPEDDGEEFRFEGKEYRVPKELQQLLTEAKAERHKREDYTQKTMEASHLRRQAEDRLQFLDAREQLLAAAYEDAAEYRALQMQHKQYESLDWAALYSADPGQALKLRDQRDQLTAKITEKEKALQQRAAQNEQIRSQHLAKQLEIGRAELQRRVGALTDTDRQATVQLAKELGYSEEELGKVTDARLMHALVKLARLEAKASAASQVTAKKVQEARPLKMTTRTAPQAQRDGALLEAREKLRKTGRDEYAERILNEMFKG